ncbi:MAG: SGNH/GDSL hydrolase family protein [Verrucomicrobiia bacterium]
MTSPMESQKKHPVWQSSLLKAALVVSSFTIMLFLSEGVARWLRPDLVPSIEIRTIPDPFVGWRNLPCQSFDGRTEQGERRRIQINNLGFVDEDHALEKADQTVRVAFLGDSFTAAVHVDFPFSFVQVAGTNLRTAVPTQKWEVLNFGVTGFGTVREYLAWKYYARHFRPDVVVLAFFLGNDVANNLPGYEDVFTRRRDQKKHGWFYRAFLEPSLLYQMYKLRARDLRHFFLKDGSRKVSAEDEKLPFWRRSYAPIDWQTYLAHPDPAFEEAWKTTEQHLLLLRDEAQAGGARFHVALLPGMEAMVAGKFQRSQVRYPGIEAFEFDLDHPRRRLLDFLKRNKISTIDIQREFEEKVPPDQRQDLYYRFDLHFNTRGHRLAGEAISRKISAVWLSDLQEKKK